MSDRSRKLWRHRLVRGISVAAATSVVGVILWHSTIRDRVFPRRFGEVVPGLIYRSGQIESNLIEPVLREESISTIINLGVYKPGKSDHDAEQQAAKKLGIDTHQMRMGGDGLASVDAYVMTLSMMLRAQAAGEPMLIHCKAGSNRTCGVVAVYRLLVQNWPADRVVQEMKQFDFDPADNQKLLPFLDTNLPEIARRLRDRGFLPAADHAPPSLVLATRTH